MRSQESQMYSIHLGNIELAQVQSASISPQSHTHLRKTVAHTHRYTYKRIRTIRIDLMGDFHMENGAPHTSCQHTSTAAYWIFQSNDPNEKNIYMEKQRMKYTEEDEKNEGKKRYKEGKEMRNDD